MVEAGQAVGYGPSGGGDKLAIKAFDDARAPGPGFHIAFVAFNDCFAIHNLKAEQFGVAEFRAEMLRVFLKGLGQIKAGYGFNTRPVFHVAGGQYLPASRSLFDKQRIQPSPFGIYSGGKPGRPRAQDN